MSKSGYKIIAIFLFVVVVMCSDHLYAQELRLFKSFTTADGLPSNHIYNCVQDNKGFLWVGTDNGVSRFDGKYFKTFTSKDGVPDYDVLEVVKEKDGTIWINTFKQGPCYFDEKLNRFIDPLRNENINKDFIKLVLWVKPLDDGGIVFYNGAGECVFKNRKLVTTTKKNSAYTFREQGDEMTFKCSRYVVNIYASLKTAKRSDSVLVFTDHDLQSLTVAKLYGNKLLIASSKGFFYIVGKQPFKRNFEIDTVVINDKLNWFRVEGNMVNVSTETGRIYTVDINTKKIVQVLKGDFFANCTTTDATGNVWVGTSDKGLLLFKRNKISSIPLPSGDSVNPYFRSIVIKNDGTLYAGNHFGQVVEKNGSKKVIKTLDKEKLSIRVLDILFSQNKVFTISEKSCKVNYTRDVKEPHGVAINRLKSAVNINDSIIIAGGININGGLYKINTITEKASRLNCHITRVSVLCYDGERYLYLGTNFGLYKYDCLLDTTIGLETAKLVSMQRVISLAMTPEKLLWVGTTSDTLFVLKNGREIAGIPVTANCLAGSVNTMWVGTRNGIGRIRYRLTGDQITYKTNYFSRTDGLPGDIINDLYYSKGQIYMATDNGIGSMPEDFSVPANSIETYLTHISVNGQDQPIQSEYHLKSSQRSLTLELASVNLGGHFQNLQYKFDDVNAAWIKMSGNILNIELEPGIHKLYVSAVDVNKEDSDKVLVLLFDIDIPYYRRIWFIILVISLCTALVFLTVYQLRLQRQKRIFRQQLNIEKERNRITADLHDDIGSSLSSLRVYSTVAEKLIDKDADKAKSMMKHISETAAKILDNISDIIWSLRADKNTRFSMVSRIKNAVSEMLGPLDIDYEMHIDEDLDDAVQNIIARKNIMLIVKEAINNITKYSKAGHVRLDMIRDESYLHICISDNGIGIAPAYAINKGNGLGNMKKRTEELEGIFKIESGPGTGTTIRCEIPVLKIRDKEVC